MSVMNAEVREAACERMGQVLDEHGLYLHLFVCICLYPVSMRMYVHLSCSACQFLTVISCSQDAEPNLQIRLNRQIQGTF